MKLAKAASVLTVGLAFVTAASPGTAEARSCGTTTTTGGLQAFAISASNTTCRVARQVAGAYNGATVRDDSGRRWRCRVTREATGTDPGYYPFTHVRCSRANKVIAFKLRS